MCEEGLCGHRELTASFGFTMYFMLCTPYVVVILFLDLLRDTVAKDYCFDVKNLSLIYLVTFYITSYCLLQSMYKYSPTLRGHF